MIKPELPIYYSMLVTKPVHFLLGQLYLLVKSPGHKKCIYHEGITKGHFDISRETDYLYTFREMLKISAYISYDEGTTRS